MTIKKSSAKSPQRPVSYAVANNPSIQKPPMKNPQETSTIQPLVSPYTVSITFRCGCGFNTHILNSAISHALERKHSLEVSGWIRYLRHVAVSKVEAIKESQVKFSKYDSDISELNKVTTHDGFDELKAKLLQIQQT